MTKCSVQQLLSVSCVLRIKSKMVVACGLTLEFWKATEEVFRRWNKWKMKPTVSEIQLFIFFCLLQKSTQWRVFYLVIKHCTSEGGFNICSVLYVVIIDNHTNSLKNYYYLIKDATALGCFWVCLSVLCWNTESPTDPEEYKCVSDYLEFTWRLIRNKNWGGVGVCLRTLEWIYYNRWWINLP